MRATVPLHFPKGFVRLRHALDFWENDGRWDCEGFDWIAIRSRPHVLRSLLINGALTAFVMTEDGRRYPVPEWLWGGVYLWGEAYSEGLVNVELERGRAAGYLCAKREDVENLKRGKEKLPPMPAAMIEALLAECPTIGLVVQALAQDADRSSVKSVNEWLSQTGPRSLEVAWPSRDSSPFPSIVRQINVVIRLIDGAPTTWMGPTPRDPAVAWIAQLAPLLGAALEVYRLYKMGPVSRASSGIVTPAQAEAELRKRVRPAAETRQARQLFANAARISIPDDRVSGGGRIRSKAVC